MHTENPSILLLTPPFTQFNTPYPATPYLVRYLHNQGIEAAQCDLGLEVILQLFSRDGFTQLFQQIRAGNYVLSPLGKDILIHEEEYINTVDIAISFLQGGVQSLAQPIADGEILPPAFQEIDAESADWAFGTMGFRDRARYLITRYLEEVALFISETIDPQFQFARYAEQMGRSATSFDTLYAAMQAPFTYIDNLLLALLQDKLDNYKPQLVGITIPFPGNLYAALRCGQYIRLHYPEITLVMGGGFVSTELRSLTDARFYEFTHHLCLDDGELPLLRIINDMRGVSNSTLPQHLSADETGYPLYKGLLLDRYLSIIELTNPMHRLWSDGRWNKLTLAHGCYWAKCTFCDTTLDYISRYLPSRAANIVDKMEQLIAETGERGFHFVDEAAPPALLKEVASEILRRRLIVAWWGNIRFEKSFTPELCFLLKQAGCIAVSGGIEVASPRILQMINKGVTLENMVRTCAHLTQAGIMVHGYLMYGFPTQNMQESIDAMEIVRQLFANDLLQSAFWHRFALTAHSGVAQDPASYHITITQPPHQGFALNDLTYREDMPVISESKYEELGEALRTSLYNYMHGVCLDAPLQEWFTSKIPATTIPSHYIEKFTQAL